MARASTEKWFRTEISRNDLNADEIVRYIELTILRRLCAELDAAHGSESCRTVRNRIHNLQRRLLLIASAELKRRGILANG